MNRIKTISETVKESRIAVEFLYKDMKFIASCITVSDGYTDFVIYRINDDNEASDENNYEASNIDFSLEGVYLEIGKYCDKVEKGEASTDFIEVPPFPEYNPCEEAEDDAYCEYQQDCDDYKYESKNTIYQDVKGLIDYGLSKSKISWGIFADKLRKNKFVLTKNHESFDLEFYLNLLKKTNFTNKFGCTRYLGYIVFENGDYISMKLYNTGCGEEYGWEYTSIPVYRYDSLSSSGYISDLC